jgi:hypothetical protein
MPTAHLAAARSLPELSQRMLESSWLFLHKPAKPLDPGNRRDYPQCVSPFFRGKDGRFSARSN